MKKIYLGLSILGAILPYWFFTDFLANHGLDLGKFVQDLFVNGPSSGFTADLLVSSTVFWVLLYAEGRLKRYWPLVLVNLGIGLSCALPLYFYYKEKEKS